ncbi:S8 family peptidase [Solitalea lacus]|uniref:S8 family peptidase n=1 Tax=Solitalea lacus TaxID=2911172 RepID=UPI001EDC6F8E|nr:S8 family peptidase [Solitalea lacus]UKJ06562.1 S8 family peptidase [Solitalea lacus]
MKIKMEKSNRLSMSKGICCAVVLLLGVVLCKEANAQLRMNASLQGWHLKDKASDNVPGISLQKAYDFLKEHRYKVNPVIVAVIDNGVDTTHEDLKNVLWRNNREIAGNGKDDDGNGYVDDVCGWNFLGNKEGKNLTTESSEKDRENQRAYQSLRSKWDKFDDSSSSSLSVNEQKEYSVWKQASQAINNPAYVSSDSAVSVMMQLHKSYDKVNKRRKDLVGDNWEDINDRNYGNPTVGAGNPKHGTHVAGTIAAERNNNLGMDGIADKARIMPIRAIPDGDERDKDVALSIRYAVDNGARVVNMSFGKDFSPQKQWVDDAVKYAQAHDVLLIHASGNEGVNVDTSQRYPSPFFINADYSATNFITVGASDVKPSALASFSNYGKKVVNVFAPGTNIYATISKKNKYEFMDGTSMAAPVVSGIATIIREYFPRLSARQVKYVIEQSVVKPVDKVTKPGLRRPKGVQPEKVELNDICTSGGIVNAYEAVKLAATLKGELSKRAVKKILKIQKR